MGEATANLVVSVTRLQLNQVTSAAELGRLEAPMGLLSSYLGQSGELSGTAVVEELFSEVFPKFQQAGIPPANTSDIQKTQHKVMLLFLRVYQRATGEMTPGMLMTPRNQALLKPYTEYLMAALANSVDETIKKVVSTQLRNLLILFNGLTPEQHDTFLFKGVKTQISAGLLQKYG